MRPRLALLPLFLLVADATVALAQTDVVLVRGRVIAAESGIPLRRASVGPARRDSRIMPVLTDSEGRFVFPATSRLALALLVSKGGYASETVQVPGADDSPPAELQVRLSRGGAISGRVADSSGTPVFGTQVVARRTDAAARGASLSTYSTQTDELGEYRIFGLPAGRYSVSSGQSGMIRNRSAVVMTLQPDSPSRTIEVKAGDDHGDVNFDVEVLPQKPGTVTLSAAAAELEALRTILGPAGNAAVTGTIVDDFGEPFQGADVQLLVVQYKSGQKVAMRTGSAVALGLGRTSDDRGRYRMGGVQPGTYLVVASTGAAASASDSGRAANLLPVYHPDTPSVDGALPVQIDDGRDTIGIDVTLTMSRGARVSGMAIDESGSAQSGSVRIVASRRSNAIAFETRAMQLSWPGGRFELENVPPGEYVVQVVGEPGFTSPARFGAAYVSVADGGDPPPVTITATPGATLEGRIVLEGEPDSRIAEVSVESLPADLDLGPARVPGGPVFTARNDGTFSLDPGAARGSGGPGFAGSSDGMFSAKRLHGPTRFALAKAPEGWYLKSVAIGGADATDAPFDFGSSGATFEGAEIVVSRAGASVSGTVVGDVGQPSSASSVVVFPVDPGRWFDGSRHVKYARAQGDGSYRIRGLPPGTYLIAATDAADGALAAGGWQDPDVLASLAPLATRLTLTESQAATATLRTTRRPR
jgi:hypothetical protein